MKRFTFFMSLLGIVVIVLTSILPAMAQDVVGECAPEELAASISDRLAEAPGDREALTDMLRSIAGEIAANDAACSGLSFEGEHKSVLGPLVIPEGIYTFAVGGSSLMTASLTLLDGECGAGNSMLPGFFIGDASAGAEGVFTSTGCETLIEVTSRDPWSLSFTKVR